ncbi:MAG: hypothetical protein E7509_00655 [Ruminococcus sp.]|nr:hypothetical protein [Ruminococcus sp.]
MNENMTKSIRLALVFGFVGAVGIPLAYECYANVSRLIALAFLVTGAVYVGFKLSKFSFKDAFVAFVFMFVLLAGFTIVGFMIIHPVVVKFLENSSRYYALNVADSVKFFVKTAGIQFLAVGVCVLKSCGKYMIEKFRENSEATGKYIENAFDDEEKF